MATEILMAHTWKTVRVFISSTFRDMQAERDHLVRFVFAKLRQELLQRRIHLVDVDLRWGVTSEQDAVSVCREVVDECRPRFFCVLGGRYGWVPPGKIRSITADEVHYGVLDRDLKSCGFAYFYFRDPSATAAMFEITPGEFREPASSHGAVALAELKAAIVEAGLQLFVYPAQWDDQSRRLIGLKEFSDRAYADLKQSIDQEFGPATGEKPDEFTEENSAMEAFIEERVQRFVLGSRQPVWNELRHHAESTGGNGYLCLAGEAGSGKSALMGKFCQEHREAHSQNLVIAHFVGASPGSTDVRRTLRRLCHELATGAELTAEIPEEPEKLRGAFPEILQQAAAKKRVVIFLDAINQFDPTTELAGWSWLPKELPAKARIILSTLSGPALDSLRRPQLPRPVEIQPLDAQDREAIIREFLHRYRKSMTDDQRAALVAKADAGTPLYLLVALEELRTLGTYEEITDRIAQLPSDTRALFIWILKRLENDDGFRDASGRKIGRELVSRFVSLLGVSRHGLSQEELVEVLSPGDPQGNVAALAQLLRPYLMQRGELLDFYHGQFREAAEQEFLQSEAQRHGAHADLAAHFNHKERTGQHWHCARQRSLTEFPYHLWQSGAAQPLFTLACDDAFLEAQERVPTEPNLFLQTIEMALRTACKTREPLRMASLTLRRARKAEARREGNPILALDDQSLSFADRISLAWAIAEGLPPQVGVYSTLLLAYRLSSIGSKAEARATVERLGERPLPELGGVCWTAILLLAELEEEFQTTRWAKTLLAHTAFMATLSERLAEIGNVSAALRIADQVDNREARDFSFFEVVKAQILTAQFEAALNTARRIGDSELRCSVLIDILSAGRSAGLDMQVAIQEQLSSIAGKHHEPDQTRRIGADDPYAVQRALSGAIYSSAGDLTNEAVLYAELGQFEEAQNLAAKILEPCKRVGALCRIALVDLKQLDPLPLLQIAEHALEECDKGSQESARSLIQETRSKVASKEGDLNLALKLASAIDNPSNRVSRLIELSREFHEKTRNAPAEVLQSALQVATRIEDESERFTALKKVALAMRKAGLDLAPVYDVAMEIDASGARRTETDVSYADGWRGQGLAELLAITGHFDEAGNIASRIAENEQCANAFCEIAVLKANLGLDPKDAFTKAAAAARMSSQRDTALRDIAVAQMQLGFDPLETFVAAVPTSAANPKPKILTAIGEIIVLKKRRKMSIGTDLRSALDLAASISTQPEGEEAAAAVAELLAREGCFEGAIEMAANLSTQTQLEETLMKLAGKMLESTSPPNAAGFYLLCAKIEDPKSGAHLFAKAGELFHKAGLDTGPIFQQGAHIAESIGEAKERCGAYCELAMSMAKVGLDGLPALYAAIESANQIKEDELWEYTFDRTPAVEAIIKALANTGRPGPAVDVALQSLSADEQSEPIAAVAIDLADTKRIDEALAAAQKIPDRDAGLQTIAEVHSRTGRHEEALRAIRQIKKPEVQCPAYQRLCRSQMDAGLDITEILQLALDSARQVQPNDSAPNPFREILELCPERDLDETEIIREAIAWADAADRSKDRKAGRASVTMALVHRGRYGHALKIAMTTRIEAGTLGRLIGRIASAQLAAGDVPGAFAAYDAVLADHSRALEMIDATLLDSADGGLENGALAEYLMRACKFVDSSIRACAVICQAFPESSEDVLNLLNSI
jgi:hypothetical protein